MKALLTKKLFASIITVMMFSILPALVNAQKKCTDGKCPNGQICSNGYCVKYGGGGWPCFRPCGGWYTIYYSGSQSATISFFLDKPEKISVKIFNMTGRLVKTLTDKILEQGEHQLQWDAAGVNAGVYIVQFNTGTYSETQKISVLK